MAATNLPYFLLGVGLGAAMGILYAPSPGEELRTDLRRRAGDGRQYVKRQGGALRQQAESVLDKGRDAVSSQREQLAAALEAGRRAYHEATGRDPSAMASRSAGA